MRLPEIQVSVKDAIALKCLECGGNDWANVKDCPSVNCALFTARPKGRKDTLKKKFYDKNDEQIARPIIKKREMKKEMTPEQRKAASERFKKMWRDRNDS